ncbi:MAG: RNA polymerase sigma factor [Bacteroidetes bacterium]|nr:MAG: RNA polymerase sigma factor [Bacteroidota bacterium]
MTNDTFSEKINQFDRFLHNFALRLTQNSEKAKDLVQDTCLRAFRYRDKYQLGTNFKGWIATIMRNTFINNYRKEQKRRVVSEPVEALAYQIETKTFLSNAGEMNMRMQELMQMLDSIGDLYRVPFLMHYRGYEYQEIADKLQLPIGTVKSRIFTARKKLKALLNRAA